MILKGDFAHLNDLLDNGFPEITVSRERVLVEKRERGVEPHDARFDGVLEPVQRVQKSGFSDL